jgi:hypothetical protein
MKHVLNSLLNNTGARVIEKATIARNGSLTDDFKFLEDYVGKNAL